MDKLLLEIGTEEIPAGYIEPALNAMAAELTRRMKAARIEYGEVEVFGTPRRLTVMVDAVAPKQTSLSEYVMGPPENIAFDGQGNPQTAALKFAEKVGVSIEALKVKATEKGRYLFARKTERGLSSRTVLKTILPKVIEAAPFPKRMKWGELHVTFARPIHSLLALLGSQIVSFKYGSVKSGRHVRGHYFMQPGKIKIDHPDKYIPSLEAARVIVDIKTRKTMVKQAIDAKAAEAGGRILEDDELLDIVNHLVEFPAPVIGRFDNDFLALPPEILITAMREHQKYFAIVDDNGSLLPAFVAVNNTVAKDMELVAEGHGRVIRARLADARFFYNSDTKTTMDAWVEKLKGVTFQAKLGTMHAKALRVQRLAEVISDFVTADKTFDQAQPELKAHAGRTALLSKADLVSEVVGEFPKLQGVMGRIYADVFGEPSEVSNAIEEHYRPTHSGGALPQTITGAVVSIADKLDSICGFFSVGLIPTGGADPYALRRQGIGVIQIMAANRFSFLLGDAVAQSFLQFEIENEEKRHTLKVQILQFLKNRINNLLTEEGYPKDVVQAVTHVSVDHIPHVWARIRAVEKLKDKADFGALAGTFKRVGNIIRKAKIEATVSISETLFEKESETALHHACQQTSADIRNCLANEDFDGALIRVAALKTPVDMFFDDVMVMAEDEGIRNNRLALLGQVAAIFDQFADFSRIAT